MLRRRCQMRVLAAGAFVSLTLVATRLAAAMAAGYGTVTPEQQACLYDGLVALDDRQRTVLLVGPIVMSADPMSSRSLEYGEVTAAVRDACGVSIDGTTVAPGGPTIEGDTSDTSITR